MLADIIYLWPPRRTGTDRSIGDTSSLVEAQIDRCRASIKDSGGVVVDAAGQAQCEQFCQNEESL